MSTTQNKAKEVVLTKEQFASRQSGGTLSENNSYQIIGQAVPQYATMPTASATYYKEVAQFIGTTDTNYTHGYFYECTLSGSTYSWSNVSVQASSGGSTYYEHNIRINGYADSGEYYIIWAKVYTSSNTQFTIDTFKTLYNNTGRYTQVSGYIFDANSDDIYGDVWSLEYDTSYTDIIVNCNYSGRPYTFVLDANNVAGFTDYVR